MISLLLIKNHLSRWFEERFLPASEKRSSLLGLGLLADRRKSGGWRVGAGERGVVVGEEVQTGPW